MEQIIVEKHQFDRVRGILKSLFPAFDEFAFKFNENDGKIDNEYYFLVENGEYIGIINVYRNENCPKSLWLGWFGILEKYRNKGFGSQAIELFEQLARQKGFTHTRIFTDKFENDGVIKFYKKNGYKSEDYKQIQDQASLYYKVLIFSKNLFGGEVEPWNNKNIYLTLELKKQK